MLAKGVRHYPGQMMAIALVGELLWNLFCLYSRYIIQWMYRYGPAFSSGADLVRISNPPGVKLMKGPPATLTAIMPDS